MEDIMNKKTLLVLILTAITVSVFAQTTASASITLTGVMDKKVAITATGVGNYDSLDMSASVADQAVVLVNEYSNVREGYTVTLSSANASSGDTADAYFLGAEGSETLTYTITYDGVAVSFGGGSAEITSSNDKTPLAGTDKSLAISYNAYGANDNLGNDIYTDELTFTITAK